MKRDVLHDWALSSWDIDPTSPPYIGWAGADDSGFNILHYLVSAESDNANISWFDRIDVALSHGAPLCSAEYEMGNTALHWAAWQGSPECARSLLAHGASYQVRNRNGERPLDILERRIKNSSIHHHPARFIRLYEMLFALDEQDQIVQSIKKNSSVSPVQKKATNSSVGSLIPASASLHSDPSLLKVLTQSTSSNHNLPVDPNEHRRWL